MWQGLHGDELQCHRQMPLKVSANTATDVFLLWLPFLLYTSNNKQKKQ